MAQIAAGIEYEAASPPAGLADDMRARPSALLRFLSIKAIDEFKVQASLWQPGNNWLSEMTMNAEVHGSGGNLSSLPLRAVAHALSAKGYSALSIRTQQHDEHVNMDNFFDVRRDIEADVATVRALGYRSIQWCGSALPFATREEAESNARDLMMRWCAVWETRVVESDVPVSYRYVDGRIESLTSEAATRRNKFQPPETACPATQPQMKIKRPGAAAMVGHERHG
jgi:hypothetical protein